ncbi:MAG: hypothetical protein U1E60_06295 [Reyranellaceae bacterium]
MPVFVEGITSEQLGRTTAEWVQAATVESAMRALREEVSHGFDPQPIVITDGVTRRDPEQVRPFGRIEFLARTDLVDAVRWTLTELQKKSPVRTGRYASSHVVLLNGAEIAGNIWQVLRGIKDGDRVQIVNTQPYARKLEGATANKRTGRVKRRPTSRQAPSGIYRRVLRALVQRYSRSLYFDLKYVALNLGVKVWGYQGGGTKRQVARRRMQRDQVYPAIQFFNKPATIPN